MVIKESKINITHYNSTATRIIHQLKGNKKDIEYNTLYYRNSNKMSKEVWWYETPSQRYHIIRPDAEQFTGYNDYNSVQIIWIDYLLLHNGELKEINRYDSQYNNIQDAVKAVFEVTDIDDDYYNNVLKNRLYGKPDYSISSDINDIDDIDEIDNDFIDDDIED